MKRVRLNQTRTASPDVCLMSETTKEMRDAELGVISDEQKRFCAKCLKWMSEKEIEDHTCDLFGVWTSNKKDDKPKHEKA